LVAADPHDCGSLEEEIEGKLVRTVPVQKRKDLSLEDLEATLTQRTSYNEWIVKDYTVLGIFAHPPCIADDVAGLPRRITLEELVQHFPGQPIFSFKDGSIYRLRPPPSAPIDPSEIYPEPA